MRLFKVFIFTISFLVLFLLNSCNENPIDNNIPPCFDCFDFRLTDFEPAWSPDGKMIAYIHGDTISGRTGIYFIDTSGTNKQLFYAGIRAYSSTWSQDGEWIAFSDNAQIFKMKVNSDSIIQLTFEGKNFSPSWSPDGEWIAYDSNVDSPNGMNFIWKIKADGTQEIRITYDPKKGEIRMPDWSPDGNSIVHIRYSKDFNTDASEICVMDKNGNNVKRLTFNNDMESYPKYSPDGTSIVYTSEPYGGSPQIWVMNSDGTNQKQLTVTQGYSCDWSPDGEWIVYTDSRAVNGMLWIMRKDGRNKHQITFD